MNPESISPPMERLIRVCLGFSFLVLLVGLGMPLYKGKSLKRDIRNQQDTVSRVLTHRSNIERLDDAVRAMSIDQASDESRTRKNQAMNRVRDGLAELKLNGSNDPETQSAVNRVWNQYLKEVEPVIARIENVARAPTEQAHYIFQQDYARARKRHDALTASFLATACDQVDRRQDDISKIIVGAGLGIVGLWFAAAAWSILALPKAPRIFKSSSVDAHPHQQNHSDHGPEPSPEAPVEPPLHSNDSAVRSEEHTSELVTQ